MRKFADWAQALALALGAPGLFLAALADSSFLPLPEVVDLLLVWMTTQHKSRMLIYATSATLGSVAGCLILYGVGRRGDQFIQRRFSAERVERALAAFRRYGLMAVLIPSLLPPPMPFKIFVLLAGAAGISTGRFVLAIAIGRGIRYFGEGLLAVWYGDQALLFLEANGRAVSMSLATLCIAGLAGYVLWQKTRRSGRQ
ncbi:MAG TPA: VTT domain-containing protein [Vicinamibacterales bacterium]|nr:VTT domain-containing protein [Vicinamibacterales bacterium]